MRCVLVHPVSYFHVCACFQAFASTLAARHYERTLARRAWAAWRAIIENSWRQRVERACQAKAQEVCVQLTDDYERKINQVRHGLRGYAGKEGTGASSVGGGRVTQTRGSGV